MGKRGRKAEFSTQAGHFLTENNDLFRAIYCKEG
jgi:hypothetical protein